MKILFVWTGVTSYMADAWRRLQALAGVELKVVVETAASGSAFDAARVFRGLDVTINRLDVPWTPDVIFAGGWRSPTTREMLRRFPTVPKVFCLDMPWRNSPRCVAARWVLGGFLRRFDAIYVPGARSAKYARWLGFAPERIFRRLYAVDFARLRSVPRTAPKGFLYVGRYAPEKRVDLIERAYRRYRELGGTWEFDAYGQGGRFAQADEMPRVYAEHRCLLMASAFDPWPLVVLESKAAKLEVIASDRCGNATELGAEIVPYGKVEAMARRMLAMERGELARSEVRLEAYDVNAWAMRTLAIAGRVRVMASRGGYCPGRADFANGMAEVAARLGGEPEFRDEWIVHGAWLPAVGWATLKAAFRRGGYLRMPHGAYSPLYLEGRSRFMKRLLGFWERWGLRHAKAVLATSAAEEKWILAYEPRSKVRFVDLKRAFRFHDGEIVAPEAVGRPLKVLYLGRLHPFKGVELLKTAVKRLNGRLPGAVELRVETQLVLEEREAAFRDCDLVCLPSLSENFGLVVAEALERRRPVIVTDGAEAWAGFALKDTRGASWPRYLKGFVAADDHGRIEMLAEALAAVRREAGTFGIIP